MHYGHRRISDTLEGASTRLILESQPAVDVSPVGIKPIIPSKKDIETEEIVASALRDLLPDSMTELGDEEALVLEEDEVDVIIK